LLVILVVAHRKQGKYMECDQIQQEGLIESWGFLSQPSQDVKTLDCRIDNIAKMAFTHFLHESNECQDWMSYIAGYWPDDAPHTQQDIRDVWEASKEAKEEANQHMKNSWEAFGNNNLGTVVRESCAGWSSLQESDRLAREAVKMENENIAYCDKDKGE